MRIEISDCYARRLRDPFRKNSRTDHEGAVIAIVGEHVERRAQKVRRYPPMRHIPDELRGLRIAKHDFRPLPPFGWPLSEHEEVGQLVGALRLSESTDCAGGAPLVRRLGAPRLDPEGGPARL